MKPLIVDALATVRGRRIATRDVIGAGPRTVAGVLERRGGRPSIALAEEVLGGSTDPSEFDLLLVSGMTADIVAVRRVIGKWRRRSGGPVIVGGPIASSPRDAIIKARADLAVIGEGELTLDELMDLGLDGGVVPPEGELCRVPGIAYKVEGDLRVNSLRPVMSRREYDGFSSSTKAIRDYPFFFASRVYVEVLRGCSNYIRAMEGLPKWACAKCKRCSAGSLIERYDCPMGFPPGCGYCSVPSLFGPSKSRSTERIRAEVEELLSQGVRRVVLSAPDFLDYGRDLLVEPEPLTDPRLPEPNYPALEELLSSLSGLDRFSDGGASLMIENVKGSLVTDRAAEILGRYLSGSPVSIGLETGSAVHSSRLGRPSTPRETLIAVRRLKRAGLKPYVYFIHGLPGQSAKTAGDTVGAIEKSIMAGASRIILYRFQPLPMSSFRGHPRAPPTVRDGPSREIHEAVVRGNRALKEELVGTRLRAVIAEPYDRDRRLYVAYPMLHGPVVLLEHADGMEGSVVDVIVESVVSDRIVKGRRVGVTL